MVRAAAVALLFALPSAAPAQVPSNLQAEFSQAHAYAARKSTDRFADRPQVAAGKAFKVTFGARDGDTTGDAPTSAFWTYKDGELSIVLGMRERPRTLPAVKEGFNVGGAMSLGKPYRGTNAFGASTMVRVENWRHDALAVVGRPRGTPHDRFPDSEQLDQFSVKVPTTGANARQLIQHLRIVVEGVTAPLVAESAVECDSRGLDAQISAPIEYTDQQCWIGADVSRIAIVDSREGKVLGEWVSAAGKP